MADQTLTVEDLEDSQEYRSTDTSKEEVSYEDDFQETPHHITSEDIVRQYQEQSKTRGNHGNNNNGYHKETQQKQTRSEESVRHREHSYGGSNSISRSRRTPLEDADARNPPPDARTRGRRLEEEYGSQGDDNDQQDEGIKEEINETVPNGHHHDDDDDNREFFEYLDSFGEDGERLMSSSEAEIEDGGPKIIHLDHVDYILDNIDAELSHLINKSMVKTVYASKQSKSNSAESERRQSKQTREERYGGRNQKRNQTGHHHHRDGTDEGTEDTGLGSGSHMEETEENNNSNNNVTHKSSKHHYKQGRRKTSTPLKIPIIEVSDADSVTSEEVHVRLQETLRKHNPVASVPMHARTKTHPSTLRTKQSILENVSKLDSNDLQKVRDFGRQRKNGSDNMDEESQQVQLNRHQETPRSASRKSQSSVSRRSYRPRTASQRSRSSSQSTALSQTASERSRTTSHSSANQSRTRRMSEDGSVATEDFEHAFETTRTPNTLRFLQPAMEKRSKKTSKKMESGPVKANHQIRISEQNLYMDETPTTNRRPLSRKHRKSSTEPSRPSGLPEYMYLRKDVGESDLGSDSIQTEDYEGLFAAAMIPRRADINPKSSLTRKGSPKSYGGQMSDPESIKTEEFERHFRGLMVKQVAGVPVRNFDTVTINSDLDSVRTTDVYHQFQDALQRSGNSSKGMVLWKCKRI
ncbi:uncharacterized protein [Amphiura filiformis]|uniref:uncharacterized protein n=1 Tax=Amphiura filiformis TaxID=82378 RepID=UPI003B21FB87